MDQSGNTLDGKKGSRKASKINRKSKRTEIMKASKSLMDLTLFNSKKRKAVVETPNFAASSWDVYDRNQATQVHEPGTNLSGGSAPPSAQPLTGVENDAILNKLKVSVSSSISDEHSVSEYSSVASSESVEEQAVDSVSLSSSRADVASKQEYERNALKSVSRSTSAMSSQAHLESKDMLPHLPGSTKKFLKHFSEVDRDEGVLNYYVCAYVADILHQGTLFITEKYFAFYSNIFGYVNKILIPISDVTAIKKKKTASFIPNAIGIQTDVGKMYVFSSLISRENTYKFMDHMWRKSRKILDSDSDPSLSVHQEMVGEESQIEDSGSSSCDSILEEESEGPFHTPEGASSAVKFIEVKKPFEENGIKKTGKDPFEKRSRFSNDMQIIHSQPSTQVATHSLIDFIKMPIQYLRNGLDENTSSSFLLWSTVIAVFILLVSAGYMMYRVEILTRQIDGDDPINYNTVYEQVLHMQQKLHSGTAEEMEKTLVTQLKQISMIRQSLEALSYLFNKDYSTREKVQENVSDA